MISTYFKRHTNMLIYLYVYLKDIQIYVHKQTSNNEEI